jgi:hypothetical protein
VNEAEYRTAASHAFNFHRAGGLDEAEAGYAKQFEPIMPLLQPCIKAFGYEA